MREDNDQDYSTRTGAAALADLIEEYWRARGYEVLLSLEEKGFHPVTRSARFEVKSDLVDGLPRKRNAQRAA
ncbi:hypothetical protein [Candidatus Viadribacter manganicus]|uniref:Phosphoglycolate phosphatase n=1 Tax=Candidatus Viadribacter manganicus TaxID=1759059 RepID=A0A1B1AJL5_9PROT|nr:hypothetical protein [Candidatus Viadribacter manganicus]ANP46758.1 hypothetical protein ATE48_12970 [Candidatus Viadribacter manganicus]